MTPLSSLEQEETASFFIALPWQTEDAFSFFYLKNWKHFNLLISFCRCVKFNIFVHMEAQWWRFVSDYCIVEVHCVFYLRTAYYSLPFWNSSNLLPFISSINFYKINFISSKLYIISDEMNSNMGIKEIILFLRSTDFIWGRLYESIV